MSTVRLTLNLSVEARARLQKQADRFGQTAAEYAWSWIKCGLESDEDDDPAIPAKERQRRRLERGTKR